jgi:hypothetical protein
VTSADYMREWRNRPENQDRLRAAAAARHRALRRLAAEYPERFQQLLAEETP